MTKYFTDKNQPITYIYTNELEEPIIQNDFSPVKGTIILVTQSADLYTEVELPLHSDKWLKDAQELGDGWWVKDEQFLDVSKFNLSEVFETFELDINPDVEILNSILMKSTNNINSTTNVQVRVILHDEDERLNIDKLSETKVVTTQFPDDQFIVTYKKLVTRKELLQVAAVSIINMI